VTRVSGANRYDTSVAASKNAPRSATVETAGVVSHRVYIAVGTNFPDALAGAGVAGIRHAPVLLVQQNSIPQAVIDEIKRLNPREIVILGGTAVVSSAVANQLRALLG
jgi:putative cell wall-binding protein